MELGDLLFLMQASFWNAPDWEQDPIVHVASNSASTERVVTYTSHIYDPVLFEKALDPKMFPLKQLILTIDDRYCYSLNQWGMRIASQSSLQRESWMNSFDSYLEDEENHSSSGRDWKLVLDLVSVDTLDGFKNGILALHVQGQMVKMVYPVQTKRISSEHPYSIPFLSYSSKDTLEMKIDSPLNSNEDWNSNSEIPSCFPENPHACFEIEQRNQTHPILLKAQRLDSYFNYNLVQERSELNPLLGYPFSAQIQSFKIITISCPL